MGLSEGNIQGLATLATIIGLNFTAIYERCRVKRPRAVRVQVRSRTAAVPAMVAVSGHDAGGLKGR